MSFAFVDNTTLEQRQMRKLIRSHVMKGKNSGKKRPPKPRHEGNNNDKNLPAHMCSHSRANDLRALETTNADASVATIRGLVGIEFSSIAFPVEMTSHIGHRIHQCKHHLD